jgi:gliding motility-associated-like protein
MSSLFVTVLDYFSTRYATFILNMTKRLQLFILAIAGGLGLQAQLTVTNALTPTQLVQDVLLGGGVTAFNVTYNGQINPPNNQPGRGRFTAVNSNLGLGAGVILSSGRVVDAANPGNFFASNANNTGSDADLVALSGQTINDRSVLEFDFIPTGDTLRFRYVFGSEEYPEYVCSNFNDAFGFFLSGPGITGPFSNNARNIALVPNTNVPVTINTVNPGTPGFSGTASTCAASDPNWQANSVYYVDNQTGATVAYDGFTVVLTAFALVQCGQTYHIKLAIGDGFDSSFDSAVFLEAGSFTSTGQVQPSLTNGFGNNADVMLEGCGPYEIVFERLGDINDSATVTLSAGGTATPGVDYFPEIPTELVFAAGQASTSIFVDVPPDVDGVETLMINVQQLIQCAGVVLQTSFTYFIDSPPPLSVITTNINSICGQSNVLAPNVSGGMGQYSYLWSNGATTPTITVSPGVTTTYSVTVSDICAVEPVTADIIVTLPIYPPLELEVSPPTQVDCLGTGPIEVVSVTGGDNTFTYEWTLDGNVVGTTPSITVPASPPIWYVVTVTDGCGSFIQDSVEVSTVPLPAIEITTAGDVTVICPGDTIAIAVTDITGGNGVYTLAWTNAAGTLISTDYSVEVGVPADHVYTITVNDQCGYIGSATVTTFLPIYEPFQLDLTPDLTICAGDSTVLQALVTGGSGYFFVDWADMSFTDPVMMVSPVEDMEYTVTVTDQCGERLMDRVVVGVEYVFTSIVVTNRGQDDWYLQAATDPFAETWLWDMGDGTRYRGKEVLHSYLDLEEHWVTLRIVTPNGCPGIDSVLLRPPAHIYFPNAFTPDGDGINDLFGAVGHYIEDFELIIFDRWGNEVFSSKDMNVHWDGRVNGSGPAVNGVYVYKYRASGHLFPNVEGYGHVTLIAGSQD